jgi:hypothetical protein
MGRKKNDFIRRASEVVYDIILNKTRNAASIEELDTLFTDIGIVSSLNYDLLPVGKNKGVLQNEKNNKAYDILLNRIQNAADNAQLNY